MAAINTTYGNGGVQTTTEGIPLTSGGDLNSVLAELVRRRLANPVQPQVVGSVQSVRMHPMAPEAQEKRIPTQLERAQERAALMKLQAAEQGPPMHYTMGGFNNPHHLEMDDQHMNAYQRQLYLPQSSTFQRGGADTNEDELQLAAQLRALYGR